MRLCLYLRGLSNKLTVGGMTRRQLATHTWAWIAALPVMVWSLDSALAADTRGFVVSGIFQAMKEGDPGTDCPDGLALGPRDYFVLALPDGPERRRLLADAVNAASSVHRPTLQMFDQECKDPMSGPDRGVRLFQGASAPGIDLDDSGTSAKVMSGTCKHDNFVGTHGEPGVDNQLQRATGCIQGYRRSGHPLAVGSVEDNFRHNYQSGQHTILIEVSGIDNEQNDPDVTVGIYSSKDTILFDGAGRALDGASFLMHPNSRFHNVAHGKIVDGILTTDPIDLKLELIYAVIRSEYDLKAARLRIDLKQEGHLSGVLAGYYDVETFYDAFVRQTSIQAPVDHGITCGSFYRALHRLADGAADPVTGECKAISSAFSLELVHAHVVRPNPESTTAKLATNGSGDAPR